MTAPTFARALLLALFAVAALGLARGDDGQGDEAGFDASSGVHVLTSATFDDAVHNLGKAVLVEFYAPWCGHCRELKPVYEEAAGLLKESGLDAALAAVDATAEQDIATKYEVTGFPTLKLFKRGKMVAEYQGARSAAAIVAFLEDNVLPPVIEITSEAEYERLAGSAGVALAVGHFTVPDNEAAEKAFIDAAKKLKDADGYDGVRFAVVKSSAVASAQGMLATPFLKMIRLGLDSAGSAGESREVEFDFFTEEGFNEQMISEWLTANVFPHIAEVTADNYSAYDRRGLPFAWCFVPGHGSPAFDADKVENTDAELAAQTAAVSAFREVAKAHQGRLSFVWLSAEDYAEHAASLGVPEGSPYALVVQEMEESGPGKKFLFDARGAAEVDTAAATKWVGEYLAGSVKPHLKSQPVPEGQDDEAVKTVVAATFDEMVYENDDDVLIAFVAPWCGHCKQLEPVYDDLAAVLQDVPGITVARIDATANDVPPNIEGFPTIYFKRGDDKEHRLAPEGFYEGERNKDAMLKFIREKGSTDLSNMAVPVDLEKINAFIDGFESFKEEVARLVAENKELQDTVDELTGGAGGDADPFADSTMFDVDEDEVDREEEDDGRHGRDEL